MSVDDSDMCPYNPTLIIVLASVTTVVILFIIVYKLRWFLKWHFYRNVRVLRCKLRREPNFRYDAFVSYEQEVDYRWMKNELLPRAEEEWGFRLLVGQRDWLIGSRAECVVESIQNSRKVILVVTRNYVNCQWCDFEVNMMLVDKQLHDIVILLMEDVTACRNLTRTLAFMLKRQQSVIEWTDDGYGQNLFWEKLKNFLA
jgi:hypothetical protein